VFFPGIQLITERGIWTQLTEWTTNPHIRTNSRRPLPQNKTSPRYGGDAIRSLRMWMITGDTDETRGMTSLEYMRTPRYVMKS